MSWWRPKNIILILMMVSILSSCSVFNRTDYNWSMYGGHSSRAPYGEINFPDFSDSVIIELNFSPAYMIPADQGIFLWDNQGSLYWLDYLNQNPVLVREESSPVSAVLKKDNTIYTVYANGLIVADDAEKMETAWTWQCKDSIFSTPVIYQNIMAVQSQHNLWLMETSSGEILYTDTSVNSQGCANLSLNMEGSKIFSGTNRGEIFCLDVDKQEMNWIFKSNFYFPVRSTPLIVKDQVQVIFPNGILTVIDKDEGRLIAEFQIEPVPDLNYFCFHKDIVYLSSYPVRKYLLAYSLSKNSLLWKIPEVGGTFLLFKNKILILSNNQLCSVSTQGDQLNYWKISIPIYCFSYQSNQLILGGENSLIIYK
ncbi:MAG: PQQ-binding-like beta-propeller repeat protein [bacterium]